MCDAYHVFFVLTYDQTFFSSSLRALGIASVSEWLYAAAATGAVGRMPVDPPGCPEPCLDQNLLTFGRA